MTATAEAEDVLKRHLVWDAHSCLPLHPDMDVGVLERHRAQGVDFVSVNVGMDMNPLEQVMAVLAGFRAQVRRHADRFVLAGSVADVERARAGGRLAVAFDLEGGVPLLGRTEMVALFYDLGVRQIHLAYNRNNPLGGGCYDDDVPLTPLGRRMVAAINAAGMLMDCSHTGHRTSLDVMAASTAPVFFSHANPRALCDDGRNVTDAQIDACVATGGVVCVNGVGRFLGDLKAGTPAIVRHVDHLVQRVGPERVGLGIDYCYPAGGLDENPKGLVKGYWWPKAHGYANGLDVKLAEPEQLPGIVAGLLKLGYAEGDLARILGGNMRDLAAKVWR
ncbi:MAG: membrane dipeptidase [Geminicoccaceae bacterium]|nr:membrane dipeptidase [Geminicoccaceae bacterium]